MEIKYINLYEDENIKSNKTKILKPLKIKSINDLNSFTLPIDESQIYGIKICNSTDCVNLKKDRRNNKTKDSAGHEKVNRYKNKFITNTSDEKQNLYQVSIKLKIKNIDNQAIEFYVENEDKTWYVSSADNFNLPTKQRSTAMLGSKQSSTAMLDSSSSNFSYDPFTNYYHYHFRFIAPSLISVKHNCSYIIHLNSRLLPENMSLVSITIPDDINDCFSITEIDSELNINQIDFCSLNDRGIYLLDPVIDNCNNDPSIGDYNINQYLSFLKAAKYKGLICNNNLTRPRNMYYDEDMYTLYSEKYLVLDQIVQVQDLWRKQGRSNSISYMLSILARSVIMDDKDNEDIKGDDKVDDKASKDIKVDEKEMGIKDIKENKCDKDIKNTNCDKSVKSTSCDKDIKNTSCDKDKKNTSCDKDIKFIDCNKDCNSKYICFLNTYSIFHSNFTKRVKNIIMYLKGNEDIIIWGGDNHPVSHSDINDSISYDTSPLALIRNYNTLSLDESATTSSINPIAFSLSPRACNKMIEFIIKNLEQSRVDKERSLSHGDKDVMANWLTHALEMTIQFFNETSFICNPLLFQPIPNYLLCKSSSDRLLCKSSSDRLLCKSASDRLLCKSSSDRLLCKSNSCQLPYQDVGNTGTRHQDSKTNDKIKTNIQDNKLIFRNFIPGVYDLPLSISNDKETRISIIIIQDNIISNIKSEMAIRSIKSEIDSCIKDMCSQTYRNLEIILVDFSQTYNLIAQDYGLKVKIAEINDEQTPNENLISILYSASGSYILFVHTSMSSSINRISKQFSVLLKSPINMAAPDSPTNMSASKLQTDSKTKPSKKLYNKFRIVSCERGLKLLSNLSREVNENIKRQINGYELGLYDKDLFQDLKTLDSLKELKTLNLSMESRMATRYKLTTHSFSYTSFMYQIFTFVAYTMGYTQVSDINTPISYLQYPFYFTIPEVLVRQG